MNGKSVQALVDTGSSESFVSHDIVEKCSWLMLPAGGEVSMASTALSSKVQGYCIVDVELDEHVYKGVHLKVLPKLCADVILGHDVLGEHESVQIPFGGPRKPLTVCGLTAMKITPPALFGNLSPDCKPVATKSRHYSTPDAKFIEAETSRLLSEGIIEPSVSPWRAQVLVTSNENHKKRMVVDYSQTINRFTAPDAYPIPNLEHQVGQVAKFKVFSTIDLECLSSDHDPGGREIVHSLQIRRSFVPVPLNPVWRDQRGDCIPKGDR